MIFGARNINGAPSKQEVIFTVSFQQHMSHIFQLPMTTRSHCDSGKDGKVLTSCNIFAGIQCTNYFPYSSTFVYQDRQLGATLDNALWEQLLEKVSPALEWNMLASHSAWQLENSWQKSF